MALGGKSNSKRIVYIEDAPEMIELVSLLLTRRGFHLTGALSGQEGLEIMRKVRPDLVLLDLMMPDMDGWDVYRQMKEDDALKNIPVIIITIKAASVDRAMGIHVYQVDGYVTKPFDVQELLESIDQALGTVA